MNKPKRKKVHRRWLENQLARYERRIQKFAKIAYEFRQAIEILDRQEAARNQEKGETKNAVYNSGIESATGIGTPNRNIGESQLFNNDVIEAVLDKQQPPVPGH